MLNLNIIEPCITVAAFLCTILIGKIHLPGAIAKEIKSNLDTATKEINTIIPDSQISNVVNQVDQVADIILNSKNPTNKDEKMQPKG